MSAQAVSRFSVICKKLSSSRINFHSSSTLLRHYTSESKQTDSRDPGPLFVDPRIQSILQKVTGFDVNKIFRERLMEVETPQYKLMTDAELKEVEEDSLEHARERLQMPPVLAARQDNTQVLSDDTEISGFELSPSNYVFTDITYGISDRSRVMVVREPEGKLRHASNTERDRLLQTYFPHEGRSIHLPQMFEDANLEKILSEERYEYVLDRACVQFEPDDPVYIKVTQRVYEHVVSTHQYELLRSTRHFGGLAFYLALYRRMDGLVTDMIQRDLLEDAGSMVNLYHILHPDCRSATEIRTNNITDTQQIIKIFASKEAQHGGTIELALQTYSESKTQPKQQSQS